MSSGRKCYEKETLPYTLTLDYPKAEESSQVQFGTGSNFLLQSVKVFIKTKKVQVSRLFFPMILQGGGKLKIV